MPEGASQMDAASLVAGWKRRLIALADTPEYVYRNTPQHLIEQNYRRLTTFVGYSEAEVAAAEAQLGVQFPTVFRQYLLEMAKSPGDLFGGGDLAGLAELEQFRAAALDLMAETDPALILPPEAVVFLFHQGYTFLYVLACGGFDGPPMQWIEAESEPRPVAPAFADMVDAELQLMERNSRAFRERGGYYKTLYPGGGSSMRFPALDSGERPLDQPPPQKPWWRFW
jgi:hypothetical protein